MWLAQVVTNLRRPLTTPLGLSISLTIAAPAALAGLTGCENNPSPAACLNSGDPFCDQELDNNGNGGTGNSGAGGNTNVACADNPNYGKDCQLPGGGVGHWVCAGNGIDLVCAGSGTGGSGGGAGGNTAGNGGSGGGEYNCATDPNNGDPCIAADGTNGHWGCNGTGSALFCYSDGGAGGSGGTGGGGQYNCADDPQLGTPCTTSDGHQGAKVCNVSGTGLVCQCTVNCNGTGGSGGGGTGGSGGGETYNCLTDPDLGDICVMGVGICSRTGMYVCNAAGDGLRCSTNAGSPNPVGEVCANGLDDNCDGAKDEQPCVNGGGGGSGGTGGGGGSGGSGGALSCTDASSMQVMAVGASSLHILLMGQAVSNSNPWIKTLTNNQLFTASSEGGLSLSTTAGSFNYFEPNVGGGGDPMPMVDTLYCRQIGIDPPVPASCNATVIGDRHSTEYMASLRIAWQCWDDTSTCPIELIGHVPGDLFALRGKPAPGTPLSLPDYGYEEFGLGQVPPLCAP